MEVAVAVFGDGISPRFGCSQRLLLATVRDGRIEEQEMADISNVPSWQLPAFLASQGIEKLVCGVIGSASEAPQVLIAGTLENDQFVCPGGRGPPRRERRVRNLGRAGRPNARSGKERRR